VARRRLDHAAVFAAIRENLHSGAEVADRMAAVIAVCERSVPHPDWAALRELPYNELGPLYEWLDFVFEDWPPVVLAGLWFGLYNPRRGGETTADLRLGGSTRFTDDGGLEWAHELEYRPPTSAHSAILRSIYSIAYGRESGRLGNAAEWSLCLAYGAFAVQVVLSSMDPLYVLGDSDSVGVAVGFDSGDFLLVGRLSSQGFGPLASRKSAEPGATADGGGV
jgi:hypothetical protein